MFQLKLNPEATNGKSSAFSKSGTSNCQNSGRIHDMCVVLVSRNVILVPISLHVKNIAFLHDVKLGLNSKILVPISRHLKMQRYFT